MKVKEVYQTVTKQANILPITTPFQKVQELFQEMHPIHRSIYVVNDQNQLQGCITLWRFLKLVAVKAGNAQQVNVSPSLRDLARTILEN